MKPLDHIDIHHPDAYYANIYLDDVLVCGSSMQSEPGNLVEGERWMAVVEASATDGWLYHYVLDEKGIAKLSPETDEFELTFTYGDVKIMIEEPHG